MTIYIYLDSDQTVIATLREGKGDDMTAADYVDKILEDIEFNGCVCLPNGKDFLIVNADHISHIKVCAE